MVIRRMQVKVSADQIYFHKIIFTIMLFPLDQHMSLPKTSGDLFSLAACRTAWLSSVTFLSLCVSQKMQCNSSPIHFSFKKMLHTVSFLIQGPQWRLHDCPNHRIAVPFTPHKHYHLKSVVLWTKCCANCTSDHLERSLIKKA